MEPTQSAPVPPSAETLVIGAGLAGLAAALLLERQGVNVHVLEASDGVGGRVRTDEVDGFLLDRGFQVLLTAYEEVETQVDLPRLDLQPFRPGSLVWNGSGLQRMTDPFRNPLGAVGAATARVGSLSDKMRVGLLRRRLLSAPAQRCFSGPERSTLEELRALGFSEGFIDAFFRPFLGGVFLERDLETSASLFRYYFRCFSAGDVAVPSKGMQRLPDLLAQPLEDRISLNAPVTEVDSDGVRLADGARIEAEDVIVAVDGAAAARLLGSPEPSFKAAVTTYFAAPEAPAPDPMLILDGEGTGPVNHVAVMSNVSRHYAPDGMHLVSVSGVGGAAEDPDAFAEAVPGQMRRWFGSTVDRWTLLRSYRIPHALVRHPAGSLASGRRVQRREGVIVAGDHTEFASIQGALLSGRRAAEAVGKRLGARAR